MFRGKGPLVFVLTFLQSYILGCGEGAVLRSSMCPHAVDLAEYPWERGREERMCHKHRQYVLLSMPNVNLTFGENKICEYFQLD